LKRRQIAILSIALLTSGLILGACASRKVTMPITSAAIAIPITTKRADPLTCPVLGKDPDQAELGSFVYCQVCMTCHGDVGQGLDQLRKELQPPDNNCFQAGCHGKKHPPEGFIIPDTSPPVIGKGILDKFGDALTLHNFLVMKIPWWKPGYLKPEEYWQLTAFLLVANGIDPGIVPLDEKNAEQIKIITA
jgi:hypothetical protein